MSILEHAPAKINLYLHVTGKRADGYHLLDSLVVFARDAADRVQVKKAGSYTLGISGPEAGMLNQEDPEKNLITIGLRKLAELCERELKVSVQLEKHLPVASGIGGGSSDAGAALRAVGKLWELAPTDPHLQRAARFTGADVPACLYGKSCYFGGIGDELAPIENLPQLYLLLVNPHVPLPTKDVFAARKTGFSQPARLKTLPKTAEDFAAALRARTNDLESAAIRLCGPIGDIVDMLNAQKGCLLARMSGSGATCFGVFADEAAAQASARKIKASMKDYWVAVSAA